MSVRVTGQQAQLFSEALRDAFTLQRLREMLLYRLDKRLDDISLGADLRQIVFDVIRTAEAEGWTLNLLRAAREANPGNPALQMFAQQFGAAPATPPRPELERIIRASNSFFDLNQWLTRLGEIEYQVCRIEVPSSQGTIYGTGFLLGPDLVMTNWHVMEPLITGKEGASAQRVTLRFDYKRLNNGQTLNPGKLYRLASNWLVDSSPVSQFDGSPDIGNAAPDELDYALLRVEGTPGIDQPGNKSEPGGKGRGWLKVSTAAYGFELGTALFIVQHPQGGPLQLALDTDAVVDVNTNRTRVRYKTNTEPGSSGSPCFNNNWDLVALHHAGDPNFDPTYNQGVPFSAILDLLAKRGFGSLIDLGAQ